MMTSSTTARWTLAAAAASALLIAAPAEGQDDQATIDDALRAAPAQLAGDAKVMTMDGKVLRDGDGAYTCFPGTPGGPGPMCLDDEWMRWADAWMHKKEFEPSKVGVAYMLAGDMPDGGASNIDPFATAKTADNQWVVEGPHIMVIGPAAMLEGLTTDPDAGGPYVMWQGTPYQHIMVPTGPRPE